MKNIIYIKYGELVLKGKNKMIFINTLFQSIKKILLPFNKIKLIKQFDNIIVSGFNKSNKQKIIDLLTQVPGINLIIPAIECDNKFAKLEKAIVSELTRLNLTKATFKVNSKRADKSYPLNSMELSKKLGGSVLTNFKDWKVNLHTPDLIVNVEIRLKNRAIFYFHKIKGRGGFPLGINGRVLMLISGGIDSPVAANLLIKKGFIVDYLTFISPPHTDERALNKVRDLVNILSVNKTLYKPKLYIVNFTPLQHEIAHISNHSYQITLMRRYFFRLAKDVANLYKYDAIATGESLGQVASQTIQSLTTIESSINELVVLRPLITYDKQEIIDIAKKINTYETSILPYADSCSLFVPANPVTKPTIHTAKKLEEELTLIDGIYKNILIKHLKIES